MRPSHVGYVYTCVCVCFFLCECRRIFMHICIHVCIPSPPPLRSRLSVGDMCGGGVGSWSGVFVNWRWVGSDPATGLETGHVFVKAAGQGCPFTSGRLVLAAIGSASHLPCGGRCTEHSRNRSGSEMWKWVPRRP